LTRIIEKRSGSQPSGIGPAEWFTGTVRVDVGTEEAMRTAIGIARAGGGIGRVGIPHYEAIPGSEPAFYNNLTIGGGLAPVRAYIQELLPDVLEGKIEPGRVFDRVIGLDEVPDGYRAMKEREAIKVTVKP
jgi:threonine dehydrogenase-like Zn-dependent dehydrogenase